MDKNHMLKAVFSLIPPPLSVSISPLTASTNIGKPLTFASAVAGGTLPYSYQWYLDGNPVSGATSSTWTFIPTAGGTYFIYLKVTDAKQNTVQSDIARIMVEAKPVGGSSFQIGEYTTTKPLTLYLALIAILATGFTTIKRKTTRKTK